MPEALAQGYLAPVLSWLAESEANERDTGGDGAARQIFTNATESVLMFGTRFVFFLRGASKQLSVMPFPKA